MIFDNPDDDARARVAFELLAELCENDSDFALLIAVIRTYREVKRERRQKRKSKSGNRLTVIKNNLE